MKTMTIFLLSFCWLVSNATIWRVNNNPQINASFSSLQNAINSVLVLNGDTVYLENGSYSGATTLTKNLVIIGPGYFLSASDSTYANPSPALISSLTVQSGGAGSKIMGASVIGDITLGSGSNNMIIERSYVGGRVTGNGLTTGVIIRQCYLVDGISGGNFLSSNVYNNIITGYVYLTNSSGCHNVYNNVIYFTMAYSNYGLSAVNASVFNNILIRETAVYKTYCVDFTSSTNSSFDRNIMSQPVNATFPDNLYDAVKESIFTLSGATEQKWELKSGSPAIGYGFNGDDCGVYAGPMHYVLAGLPLLLPRIFKANIPSSGNGNVIPVHITAKTQEE
jgi:hypothetical protein